MRLVTLVPSRPAIGESLTAKRHRQRRRIDRLGVDRLADRRVGDGVGDGGDGEAGDGDDVARFGALDRHALKPAEGHDLRRAAVLDDLAVAVERVDRHVDLDRCPTGRPAGEDAAEEIVAVEQGGEQLERAVRRRPRGAGTWATIVLNSGSSVPSRTSSAQSGIAVAARGVEDREIELLVIGFERHEQFEHFVEHFGGRARRGGRSC